MDIVNILNTTSSVIDSLIGLIPKIIALASVTAAFLPPTAPYAVLINKLAFNFRHAANKNAE